MRDPTHSDFIERWARYVRDNPDTWKKEHTAFIDAQFAKHEEFVAKLRAQPGGAAKLRLLYGHDSMP